MAMLAAMRRRPAAKRMARMVVSLDLAGLGSEELDGTAGFAGARLDSLGAGGDTGGAGCSKRIVPMASRAAATARTVHRNKRRGPATGEETEARGRAVEGRSESSTRVRSVSF